MDASLRQCRYLYMHPLVNDRTVAMCPDTTQAFLESLDVQIEWTDI